MAAIPVRLKVLYRQHQRIGSRQRAKVRKNAKTIQHGNPRANQPMSRANREFDPNSVNSVPVD